MSRRSEKPVQSLFLSAAKGFKPLAWQPPTDVYRTAHGWLVKFELAGVRPDEVKLLLDGPTLVLRGIRRDIYVEEGQRSYSMEISYSDFERVVRFPCELTRMDIATDYRDGMLLVRLTARCSDDEFR